MAILRTVFPTGVCGSCRQALLAALFDEFSERNLGDFLGEFLGEAPEAVVHESIRIRTRRLANPERVAEIKELLIKNGWEFYDED